MAQTAARALNSDPKRIYTVAESGPNASGRRLGRDVGSPPRPPTSGLLVHSDRGGQDCGNAYLALLRQHEAGRSPSRRGECYDNTQAESRWSRLKTEVLELRQWPVFADLADAPASVADYFDYYNPDQLHSSIG